MDDLMFGVMFQNALVGLESGRLMDCDRMLLSHIPLPPDVIDPYAAKEVPDVQETLRLTFSAMKVWIEEAKKANYFSKRFVQMSRLVMNGVTVMGRGLITLHARGESLDDAPMSVGDLIGVASYHFRKSYLGVLQTAGSHPEISERLLMNQISWNNILMRLFRTREKLAEPVVRAVREELPAAAAGTLPSAKERALPAAAALTEPKAFVSPKAFTTYDKAAPAKARKASPAPKSAENGQPAGIGAPGSGSLPEAPGQNNGTPEQPSAEGKTPDKTAGQLLPKAERKVRKPEAIPEASKERTAGMPESRPAPETRAAGGEPAEGTSGTVKAAEGPLPRTVPVPRPSIPLPDPKTLLKDLPPEYLFPFGDTETDPYGSRYSARIPSRIAARLRACTRDSDTG